MTNPSPSNHTPQPKKQWVSPQMTKISIKETLAGSFATNPEGGACRPS